MQDLKDVTQDAHYENFRAKKLASGEPIDVSDKYVDFFFSILLLIKPCAISRTYVKVRLFFIFSMVSWTWTKFNPKTNYLLSETTIGKTVVPTPWNFPDFQNSNPLAFCYPQQRDETCLFNSVYLI